MSASGVELGPTERLSTTTFSTIALHGPSAQLTIAGTELVRHVRNASHVWDAELQTAFVDAIAVRPWTPAEFRAQLRAIHAPDVEVHVYPSTDTDRSLLAGARDSVSSALSSLQGAAQGVTTAAKYGAIIIGVLWVLGILLAVWVIIQITRGLAPHAGQIALAKAGG